jgi:hypothetical protein
MTRARLLTLTSLLPLAVVATVGVAWTVAASTAPAADLAVYRSEQWHFAIAVPADMTFDDSEWRGPSRSFSSTIVPDDGSASLPRPILSSMSRSAWKALRIAAPISQQRSPLSTSIEKTCTA